jgi:preprotein translocase subunit SecG
MIFALLMILYLLVCIILCLLVLIQSDKGGGLSGAIGGGLASANALLGTQDTANILTRGTAIFATAFMVLCIVLSLVLPRASAPAGKSVLKQRAETHQDFSPAQALQPLPIAPSGDQAQGVLGVPGTIQGTEGQAAPGTQAQTATQPAPAQAPAAPANAPAPPAAGKK